MDTLCLIAGIILGYWLHELIEKIKNEMELRRVISNFTAQGTRIQKDTQEEQERQVDTKSVTE